MLLGLRMPVGHYYVPQVVPQGISEPEGLDSTRLMHIKEIVQVMASCHKYGTSSCAGIRT